MKQAGVGFVKLAADRLLDRTRARKGAPSGAMLLEMASDSRVSKSSPRMFAATRTPSASSTWAST